MCQTNYQDQAILRPNNSNWFCVVAIFVGGVTIVTQLFPEMRVNKNDTVFIECQVSYDIFRVDLVLVWKFNGRIIDFTQDFFYEKVPIYS